MEKPFFLEKISITPPYKKIYQRLGYRKASTEIPNAQKKEVDSRIHEACTLVLLQGVFLRLAIQHNNRAGIFLAHHINFASKKLASFLRECRETVLMGATAGTAIIEAIQEETHRGNLSTAVIYDATASEMVDATLDWIMNYINRIMQREAKKLLPRRFSAGYADFDLQNQKVIYEILQMNRLGVTITPDFILIPEKSVTAISGIY